MTNQPKAAGLIVLLIGIVVVVLLALCWLRGCSGWPASGLDTDRVIGSGTAVRVQVVHDTIIRTIPKPQIVVRYLPARVRVQPQPAVAWPVARPPVARPTAAGIDSGIDSGQDSLATPADTLVARPFQAEADTIVGRDTISMAFSFPPPALSLVMRPAPDSVREVIHTQIITVPQSQPWYLEPAKLLGAALIGYGLRAATE